MWELIKKELQSRKDEIIFLDIFSTFFPKLNFENKSSKTIKKVFFLLRLIQIIFYRKILLDDFWIFKDTSQILVFS